MVTSKHPNFVLITGVSRGFGLDTEKILKAAGHRVFATMLALGWPDAFPKEDIALRNALGRISAKEAEALSQPW